MGHCLSKKWKKSDRESRSHEMKYGENRSTSMSTMLLRYVLHCKEGKKLVSIIPGSNGNATPIENELLLLQCSSKYKKQN